MNIQGMSIGPVESWQQKLENEARARELGRERDQIVLLYHRVFYNKDGLTLIAHLRDHFCTEVPAFAQMPVGPYDPYRGAVCEGQRSIILHIETMLRKKPKADANEPEGIPNVIRS